MNKSSHPSRQTKRSFQQCLSSIYTNHQPKPTKSKPLCKPTLSSSHVHSLHHTQQYHLLPISTFIQQNQAEKYVKEQRIPQEHQHKQQPQHKQQDKHEYIEQHSKYSQQSPQQSPQQSQQQSPQQSLQQTKKNTSLSIIREQYKQQLTNINTIDLIEEYSTCQSFSHSAAYTGSQQISHPRPLRRLLSKSQSDRVYLYRYPNFKCILKTIIPLCSYSHISLLSSYSHPNILPMTNIKIHSPHCSYSTPYYPNLSSLIPLRTPSTLRMVCFQLLRGYAYLQAKGVCLKGIEPKDIMVSGGGDVMYDSTKERELWWHRPPETLFGNSGEWGSRSAVWVLGVFMMEMWSGGRVFGQTCEWQFFGEIVKVVGVPSEREVKRLKYEIGIPCVHRTSIKKVLKGVDKEFVHLVQKMVKWVPEDRISIGEAIKHQYFSLLDVKRLPPFTLCIE